MSAPGRRYVVRVKVETIGRAWWGGKHERRIYQVIDLHGPTVISETTEWERAHNRARTENENDTGPYLPGKPV